MLMTNVNYQAIQQKTPPKFFIFDEAGNPIVHQYGNVYFKEQLANGSHRLVIGSDTSKVDLLIELSEVFESEILRILYVLLIPNAKYEQGRYTSPVVPNRDVLVQFLNHYRAFFEKDGRHHLWLASSESSEILVYDQHDVLFAYGDLDRYERVLLKKGFSEKKFWFPEPHGHSYPSGNQGIVELLLNQLPWQYSPLQAGDEWD